jgi:hypothetical protein
MRANLIVEMGRGCPSAHGSVICTKSFKSRGIVGILLIVGSAIAIRSGVPVAASRQGLRVVIENVSQVFLRILGYGAVMLVVHEYIGMRTTLGW